MPQQTWNHTFYWNSLRPKGGGKPPREIAEKIESSFGGYEAFKKEFAEAAVGQFGSGWAWLVAEEGKLKVVATPDAEDLLAHERDAVAHLRRLGACLLPRLSEPPEGLCGRGH